MTTIAVFPRAEDAHLLRMRLEEMGIEAFVQDENNLYAMGVDEVRVQVADENVAAAEDYLAQDAGA